MASSRGFGRRGKNRIADMSLPPEARHRPRRRKAKQAQDRADGPRQQRGSQEESQGRRAENGADTVNLKWVKSSHSFSNGNCAEVGQDVTGVLVRDSQDPGGPVLMFSGEAWAAFLAGLRSA